MASVKLGLLLLHKKKEIQGLLKRLNTTMHFQMGSNHENSKMTE